MLIWGSQGKSRQLGDAGTQHCNVCGATRTFSYLLHYKVRHIWYLIRWSSGRQYLKLCSTCGNGFPVEQADVDAHNLTGEKQANHIPFFDRLGWLVALGVIALFVIFAGIAGNADKKEEAEMISAPKVGDIYTVDVEKLLPNEALEKGSIGGDYGAFRVAEIEGDKVVLDAPKLVYSRASGVRKDISAGETETSDYYEGQMDITVKQLTDLQKAGGIYDIDRR
ncbi:hypothetical protein [Sphingorhabdus sp.]|uniref:hypothetical protein n=1 Tax=Sphingorhabdus sp. TaxID=1902408 RepID=UPI0032B79155